MRLQVLLCCRRALCARSRSRCEAITENPAFHLLVYDRIGVLLLAPADERSARAGKGLQVSFAQTGQFFFQDAPRQQLAERKLALQLAVSREKVIGRLCDRRARAREPIPRRLKQNPVLFRQRHRGVAMPFQLFFLLGQVDFRRLPSLKKFLDPFSVNDAQIHHVADRAPDAAFDDVRPLRAWHGGHRYHVRVLFAL